MSLSVAVLDMAGTTVRDDGVVLAAFDTALRSAGLRPGSPAWSVAQTTVTTTMGQSKIDVFTRILGDEDAAAAANAEFERHYDAAVTAGQVSAVPDAGELFARLRRSGVRVCLTTGFAPGTRDAIVDHLGWRDAVDLVLSPADAGRGRPWPDMVLLAALRLQADRMADVAVVGDTPSDIESGRRAGAGLVVGVTSGAGIASDLRSAGADRILGSVTDLLVVP